MNVGDTIEAFGDRAKEMVESGEAEVVKFDYTGETEVKPEIPETEEEIKARKKAWYDSHFGKLKKMKEVNVGNEEGGEIL
jgi:hypothetical protein